MRVAEAGARTRKVRIIAIGAIGLGVAAATPWYGWWLLAMFVPSAIHMITVDRWMARSDSPELVPFFTLVTMLFLLAGAVVATGGPTSPVLPWLAIVPAISALRFRMAVVLALAAVAGVLMVGVGVVSDPARAAAEPLTIIAALVMLVNVVALSTALMSGELEHRDRAVLDPLTGLLNRASLESRAVEIQQQARVTDGSVALVLLDLDRFKRVNDEYGHDRGDAVLRDTAYEIRKVLRSFELVYRIGGEEFLVLLPGADLDAGVEIAERVREAISAANPGGVEMTLSAGVATASGHEVHYDDLFRAADVALLSAKRAGRDRVVSAAAAPAVAAA
jgi:diguanylate cyclase (GGDEF)-like protein